MFDVSKLPLNLKVVQFVTPCEHRIDHIDTRSDGTQVKVNKVCALQCELAQMSIQVDAVTCAKCRLTGEINHKLVQNSAIAPVLHALGLAVLDIHNGHDYLYTLTRQALVITTGTEHRSRVEGHLPLMVQFGRLSHDEVAKLCSDHGYTPDSTIFTKLTEAHLYHIEHKTSSASPEVRAKLNQCGGCGGTKPIETDIALINAALEDTSPVEHAKRVSACTGCTAVDGKGERLFRSSSDGPMCGAQRIEGEPRNEEVDGCGCKLKDKWRTPTEHCPLNPPLW